MQLNETQLLIRCGLLLGLLVGGYLPSFWGIALLSFVGLLSSAAGGLLGFWLAYKIAQPG